MHLLFSFSLTKKKQKVKTKRSATHKASLLRVLSGSRSVFRLRWLRKPVAGVHERSEPKVFWAMQGCLCARKALGWRSWWLFEYFFAAEKSIINNKAPLYKWGFIFEIVSLKLTWYNCGN